MTLSTMAHASVIVAAACDPIRVARSTWRLASVSWSMICRIDKGTHLPPLANTG
jgi:hypothetical protein